MVIVYGLTMFLSACLLFVVQPMFARMVLPLLGGAPAVWNTAQVFYQAALLLGYAFAHVASRRLGLRRQAILHLLLLLVSLLVLPIGIPRGWTPPGGSDPIPWLLVSMLVSVGLPFFVISATSPTLQHWFASTNHRSAADPYFLYAASNIGSMLALIGYPLLIEPRLPVADQSLIWAGAFSVLIVMMAACALVAWRSPRTMSQPAPSVQATPASPERLTAPRRARWVLLAFVPSSLMLSLTTYLSTDIAATPLLWVVPLSLYLLTFVIAFSRRPVLPHRVMVRALPILLLPLVIVLAAGANEPLQVVMPMHVLTFFVAAMVCHGELARDRPPTRYLTEFYLWMSFGGALGGIFNALIAPQLFTNIMEYPLMLVLACMLMPRSAVDAPPRTRVLDVGLPGLLALLVTVLGFIAERGEYADNLAGQYLIIAAPAIFCFSFRSRPLRFGLGVAVILLLGTLYGGVENSVLYAERSFFGVVRVTQDEQAAYHYLMHGSTLHGMQSRDPQRAREPLSYYHRTGPLGQVFEAFNPANAEANVGVVGLGTGAIACYGTAGQHWTFFEIDPLVEAVARDPRYFTYLRDCVKDEAVVLGDARLSLQGTTQQYDMLVLDAYSSDAIPMHLVTREALELYIDRLAPGGVLVFHISNRHLDLEPVLGNLAQDAGVSSIIREDGADPEERQEGKQPSDWVVMARQADDLGSLAADERWQPLRTRADQPVWTDAFGSLLSVFRWQS
jgi:spermidine synthase